MALQLEPNHVLNLMPVPLPVDIVMGALPIGFKGNLQEYANAIADAMSATVTATFLTGQIGGSAPTHDIGPWANGNEWWFWDAGTSQYQPSDQGTPVGTLISWGGSGVPVNWLLCDGRPVSRVQYSRLYQAIGGTWGETPANGTFNLPPAAKFICNSAGLAQPGATGGAASVGLLQVHMPFIEVLTHAQQVIVQTGTGNATIFPMGTLTDPTYAMWHATNDLGIPLGQNQTAVPTMPPYMACPLVIKYQ